MTLPPAADLARDLAQHAEAVCRHYLPAGRRQGRYWMVGDVENAPGASLFVRLSGPTAGKGAAGKWQDAATGQHGDLLDLIGLRCGLIRFADRADEARRFLGQAKARPSQCRTPHRQIVQQRDAVRSTQAAQRLFAAARSPRDTLAAAYLQARGIVLPDGERWLRFHPRCLHRPDPASPVTFWPAMIAGVTDQGGSLIGVHRTFLSRDGRCKAPIASARRALGVLHGHAVRFGAVHNLMVVGEGIETVLSVVIALPSLPAAAALSAANLAATLFPTTLRRLYIALDNDTAGERAAMTLSLRAQEAGIDPIVLRPRRGDFNDDLRADGPDGVRSALRVQLAPEDVDRTMPTR